MKVKVPMLKIVNYKHTYLTNTEKSVQLNSKQLCSIEHFDKKLLVWDHEEQHF